MKNLTEEDKLIKILNRIVKEMNKSINKIKKEESVESYIDIGMVYSFEDEELNQIFELLKQDIKQ